MVDNKDIVLALKDMAILMELKGENTFRCRSYSNAARQIEALQQQVTELVKREELDSLRGIGKGLARNISELVKTGRMEAYQKLKASVPEGLLEMLEVSGIGAKRVRTIYNELGISDLDALGKACEAGNVEKLSGFGKRTVKNILQGITFLQKHKGQFLCSTAYQEAKAIREYLLDCPNVINLEMAGSVRRCSETAVGLDLVASSENRENLFKDFEDFNEIEQVIGKGNEKVSALLKSGMTVDLMIVKKDEFPYALHNFTGNKDHIILMQQRAKERGLVLSKYGLFLGEDRIFCEDESDIFKALDLDYIPPELREGLYEINWVEKEKCYGLVSCKDLKGTMHVHTTFSDGRGSVKDMALAAQAMGYAYIGICDHSKAAAYANGLTEDRVQKQWEEIDRVNEMLDEIWVFKGIEVDILSDGSLDFEDDFLAQFDLVVASVHSKFTMTETQATERMIRAVENPHVDILGHPTGRLLLSREGYPLNVPAVIDSAARYRTSIEVNANPSRLDLDWRYLPYAREQGVKISINTDAHSTFGLRDMGFGVGIARKGGLGAGDVLNAMSVKEFKGYLSHSF